MSDDFRDDFVEGLRCYSEAVDAFRTRWPGPGSCPTDLEIQSALLDVLGKDESHDLLDQEWTPEKIDKLLQNYSFERLRPTTVEVVELENSIIPDGIPVYVEEEVIRSSGERWLIHKNDADPFPSSPHAHCYEKQVKLHLGTGVLFSKRIAIGKIRWKDLLKLRSKIKYQPLPKLDKKSRLGSR